MSILTQFHPLFNNPIPTDWRLVTVNDIKANEQSSCVAGPFGSNISSKYFMETGVPVIRGNNLRDDLTPFIPEGFAFVSEERAKQYKAQHVRSGDLVFTCWGTLGQVGLIPENGPYKEYIISNKQLKLRPDRKQADAKFLFYYFASPEMVHHIRSIAIGSSVPGISLGILKSLSVVLPPLPVQRRIAAILSAYDDLIENNQRRIAILEELARSLYREWFVHFRFPGHEDVRFVERDGVRTPEGWDVVRYTDLVDVLSGGTPKTSVSEYWDGDIPWFTPRDRPDSFFVFDTAKRITNLGLSKCNSKLYPQDTVFITARGTVGECAITAVPMAMNQTCYALKGRFLSSQYLVFLMTLELVEALKKNATGAVFDAIVVDTFRQRFIVKPPHELATQLATFLEPSFLMIKTLQLKQVNLRRTRDLLLPRLVSGELDVSELEIAGVEVTTGND